MVTREENEKLTRVGPGTPMGELMRRYWIPAAMSSELAADGAPLRLMLLGEELVAFRDSQGRVGILDHACPHRCASLFYGRNEEGGLRCIYHGWKFDVEGRCLEMANVPPHQDFKAKIRATAYKTAERNGVVWTYMGPGEPPALPAIEATLLPAQAVTFNWMQRECNWLQVLEGDLDTSHVDFLHGGARTERVFAPDDPRRFGAINRSPEYEISETDWGTMYGAFRPADPGETYWRIAHFLFPFWTIRRADRSAGTSMRVRGSRWTTRIRCRCVFSPMPAASIRAAPRSSASSPVSKICCRIPAIGMAAGARAPARRTII
jgi:phenylpropionate dioxygenase-like ring-hydroxylating dioxygenase large terminal subunit